MPHKINNSTGPSTYISYTGKRSRDIWLVGGENFRCLFGLVFSGVEFVWLEGFR